MLFSKAGSSGSRCGRYFGELKSAGSKCLLHFRDRFTEEEIRKSRSWLTGRCSTNLGGAAPLFLLLDRTRVMRSLCRRGSLRRFALRFDSFFDNSVVLFRVVEARVAAERSRRAGFEPPP